jgi:hypothetical protein
MPISVPNYSCKIKLIGFRSERFFNAQLRLVRLSLLRWQGYTEHMELLRPRGADANVRP